MRPLAVLIFQLFAFSITCSDSWAQGTPGAIRYYNQGIFQISWDQCDPLVVGKVWTGPGEYRLVASISEATLPMIGYDVVLSFQPGLGLPFPDSWNFVDFGCQAGALEVAHNSAAGCGVLAGSRLLSISGYLHNAGSAIATFQDGVVFDPFTPDSSNRYRLFELVFDHSFSGVGPTVSGISCGGVETPMTIEVVSANGLIPDGRTLPLLLGNKRIFWLGPEIDSSPTTPARRPTWSSIRAGYR